MDLSGDILARLFSPQSLWVALWVSVGLLASLPAGAQPRSGDIGTVAPAPRDSGLPAGWQRKGVFIEILVRAYQDSNGDGIGDLNGVTQRLDYLKELGVSGIWLMPVTKNADGSRLTFTTGRTLALSQLVFRLGGDLPFEVALVRHESVLGCAELVGGEFAR